jgi:hypothetical protein
MRRRNLSNFVRRHLAAWQIVAKNQRSLTAWAVGEWKAYSVRLMEAPFRMWFVWMDQRKRKKADQQRLVTAYIRTKHRKFLWNILRGWRHQAVYGRERSEAERERERSEGTGGALERATGAST